MKRFFATLLLAIVAACAGTGAVKPEAVLANAYASVDAYVVLTTQSLQRGRITREQAMSARLHAFDVRDKLDAATAALAGCKAPPCPDYNDLMQGLQPTLLEFEAKLRAQQGGK